MSIKELFKNPSYKWGFIFLLMIAYSVLPIPIKKWIITTFLILSPIIPILGLSKWKKNSRLLNYEWIGLLVLIIIIWALMLYFIGPDFLFSLE
jgi:hypothetical protein